MASRVLQPCNLSPTEQEEAWAEFDEYLDDQESELVMEVMKNYLFYHREDNGNTRECICTHPGCGRFTMERRADKGFFSRKHGEEIKCPICGGIVELVSLGKVRNFSKINSDKWTRITLCRTGKDGALLLMSGYFRKWYSWNDLRPVPEVSWKAKTWLKPGKRMQWLREAVWGCGGCWGYEWREKDYVNEPFRPSFWGEGGDSFIIQTDKIGESALKYSQVEEWYMKSCAIWMDTGDDPVRNVVKYLSAYTRYPAMEMAVKLDLHRACTDLAVDGVKNAKDLNWDAKTINDFLRLNKQDTKVFLNSGADLQLLKGYHQAAKAGGVNSMPEYISMLKELGHLKYGSDLIVMTGRANCSLRQAVNYIKKFGPDAGRTLITWRDYLDMAKRLEYDMTRKDVLMPRDLQERHDAAAETIAYQRRILDEKKHAKVADKIRNMYEFSLGDLCIVAPKSTDDIIREGKTLHHCVGGYAARHFTEKTVILFLRHRRKPETPFVTIELVHRENRKAAVMIRQIHGYRNERYTPSGGKHPVPPRNKYKWFLDAWIKWLESGSKRDKNGKPILPAEKEKTA